MNTAPTKWAATLAPDAAAMLEPLRCLPGAELAEADGAIWLRGAGAEAPRNVPWTQRFELHDGGKIREPGCELFSGVLPTARWQNLAEALPLALPALSREGFAPAACSVSLVQSATPSTPNLAELSPQDWITFSDSAPDVRLHALRFAQTDCGRVFVLGQPLPSLPGARFVIVIHEGIAVPAGMMWQPAVSATLLRTALHLAADELIILFADRTSLRIPPRAWHIARRAIIRGHAE